jgi:hypothetical protein
LEAATVPETVKDALQEAIQRRRAVVVVGAGASIEATDGAAEASWPGLLRAGVKRVSDLDSKFEGPWKENVLGDIALGESDPHAPHLITAAEKIMAALGGKSGGEFKAWLRDTVGNLKPTRPEIIEAIAGLGVPIATTNYDGLIEEVVSLASTTWLEPSQAQLALQGADRAVVHLHGFWRVPASIIFGAQSYGTVIGNEAAQAIQQSIASSNSLLFVGVGGGATDPNFLTLRKWLRETFPDVELRHYLLCQDGEVAALREEYRGERILPLPYGRQPAELAEFLSSMHPSGTKSVQVFSASTPAHAAAEQALEAICDNARTETVLADHLRDLEKLGLRQPLIPTILLPVTHEQFVNSQDLDREVRPSRCDPAMDMREHNCILVAADEGTGLTSSLQWIVNEAFLSSGLVPVIIDFRSLGAGHHPLERQLRKELMAVGALTGLREELPPCAVAIDNVSVKPEKIFARMLDEIRDERFPLVVIGCRQGSEGDLREQLNTPNPRVALRYVGKMNTRDVNRMVSLVEPSRASRLAEAIISVTNREHLSRTPFTIGLLISVLLHGESLLGTASETAVLDAYVNLLLGRGDPHDDARFALDSLERSNILASLAEEFIDANAGSLPEARVLERLAAYFDAVGWSEDPMAVLNNLVRRHMLVFRHGHVMFTQNSFLHLFAAKRAIESSQFREKLYARTLYYGPVLRHYAALTRNDAEALQRVLELLQPAEQSDLVPGGLFSTTDSDLGGAETIDELVERLALTGPPPEEDSNTEPDDDEAEQDDDWLDRFEDKDLEPFPLERIEQAPAAVQVASALMLVSNVLRDSELVKDVELKQRALHRTLVVWGRYVELLAEDEDFCSFAEVVAELFADLLALEGQRRSKFVVSFVEDVPLLSGFAGIVATLSSRKLLRSLDTCFSDPTFLGDPRGAVMGGLLAFDLQERGWTQSFLLIQDEHNRVRAVRKLLRRFAFLAYYYQDLAHDDERRLHDFLIKQLTQDFVGRSDWQEKQARNRISQQLRLNRAKTGRSRVPAGETVFSESSEETAADGESD